MQPTCRLKFSSIESHWIRIPGSHSGSARFLTIEEGISVVHRERDSILSSPITVLAIKKILQPITDSHVTRDLLTVPVLISIYPTSLPHVPYLSLSLSLSQNWETVGFISDFKLWRGLSTCVHFNQLKTAYLGVKSTALWDSIFFRYVSFPSVSLIHTQNENGL